MTTEQAQYNQEQVDEMIAKAIRQDREFQAQVLRNLPVLNSVTRQGWIENPTSLQTTLYGGLCPQEPEAPVSTIVVARTLSVFKTADTDLDKWLTAAEKLAKEYFGGTVDLRKMFVIPETLPWRSAIPIFGPGNLTNRDTLEFLKKLGLNSWEETDVMRYSGSEASGAPTLHLIQNSIRPDEDTMGQSPDQLVATNNNWLDLRGYGLGFGLHHKVTKKYLDPKTFTWFPNNRLPDGRVADGDWNPVSQ